VICLDIRLVQYFDSSSILTCPVADIVEQLIQLFMCCLSFNNYAAAPLDCLSAYLCCLSLLLIFAAVSLSLLSYGSDYCGFTVITVIWF